MDWILILLLLVVIGGFAALFLVLKNQKSEPQKDDREAFLMLQDQIHKITQTLDIKLGESSKVTQHQFSESSRLIKEITQELTRVSEGQKQVMSITDQLQNLQDILKNPKQRGVLGEYYLETALKNFLGPGLYQTQYPFREGVIVDAVIFYQEKIIPIDSKFSLENYNRILEVKTPVEKEKYEKAFVADIKNRIDETSKYVKPEEDTMDFAIMYIPSEAIYYDLMINKVGAITEDTNSLLNYAHKKRVMVVGPTTFAAFLQTLLQGLKNQKISEQTRGIVKQVENLSKHLISYDDFMQRLGKNLNTATGMYSSAYKEFKKIDKDVFKITGKEMGIEPMFLEKADVLDEE
ncbi:MAG: DNA recombination protein RmuC [Candidatus Harrisonbacteria bacterium]|nr:DNA recombination protein RmuC [Candidatus Harrisonbacteria bacterium]